MAGKINPYDYEPEYSDDEDIGNVNVDKYEIRNSADVMTRLSDCSEGNSPLSYLDLQCWQATNRLVSVWVLWEISKHRQVCPSKSSKVRKCHELPRKSINKLKPHPTGGGRFRGQHFKSSGNFMNCRENRFIL